MIAFLGCKEEEELNISSFNDIETVSDEICIYKALYTQTDTIEYVEECFVVDSTWMSGDTSIIMHVSNEPYSTLLRMPTFVGEHFVKWPALISNSMALDMNGVKTYGNTQCVHGSVTVTSIDDSLVSGYFKGWGYVMENTSMQQDSTFDISGSFNNVNYR